MTASLSQPDSYGINSVRYGLLKEKATRQAKRRHIGSKSRESPSPGGKLVWFWWLSSSTQLPGARITTSVFVFNGMSGCGKFVRIARNGHGAFVQGMGSINSLTHIQEDCVESVNIAFWGVKFKKLPGWSCAASYFITSHTAEYPMARSDQDSIRAAGVASSSIRNAEVKEEGRCNTVRDLLSDL
eukprot:1151540-Pelagomonas_calceolata.AAC.1